MTNLNFPVRGCPRKQLVESDKCPCRRDISQKYTYNLTSLNVFLSVCSFLLLVYFLCSYIVVLSLLTSSPVQESGSATPEEESGGTREWTACSCCQIKVELNHSYGVLFTRIS